MVQDYTTYSLSELEEALANVHGEKFPEIKAALEDELRSREETGRYAEELKQRSDATEEKRTSNQKLAMIWTRVIAVYMIVSAPFIAFSYPAAGEGTLWGLVAVAVLYGCSSVGIGVGVLSGHLWAYTAAIAFHVPQLVRLNSDLFTWDVLSYIGIYAVYSEGGSIGIRFAASPVFEINVAGEANFLAGINVLAIAITSCLLAARDLRMGVARAA